VRIAAIGDPSAAKIKARPGAVYGLPRPPPAASMPSRSRRTFSATLALVL